MFFWKSVSEKAVFSEDIFVTEKIEDGWKIDGVMGLGVKEEGKFSEEFFGSIHR